jgi:hypothetical protein
MGRMLAVALRMDTAASSSVLERLARTARHHEREELNQQFKSATDLGDLSALLLAMSTLQRQALQNLQVAYEAAYNQMAMFPLCPFIVEVAAGRDCQRNRLNKFILTLDQNIREAADLKPVHEKVQYTAGAYLNFFKGYMESPVATSATDRVYMQAGANFGGGSVALVSGGLGGSGGGGGGSSSWTAGGAGGSATFGGGGGTPRSSGAQMGVQRPGGGQGQGKGTTPAPRAAQGGQQKQAKGQQQQQQPKGNNLTFGVHAPCSKTIVGEHIGLDGPGGNFTCWGCRLTGAGHFKGECPVFWGSKGKPLPGFNVAGDREPGEWNGNEPKRAAFKKWVTFLEDTDNFAADVEPANFPGAPDLDAFKDRAAHARK